MLVLLAAACGDRADRSDRDGGVSVRADRLTPGAHHAVDDPVPPCPGSRPDHAEPAPASLCAGSPTEILQWYRQLLAERSFILQGETRHGELRVLSMWIGEDSRATPTRRVTLTVEPAADGSRVRIFEWSPDSLP